MIVSSRRRRPPPTRPVRERLERRPLVGPPASTCSSVERVRVRCRVAPGSLAGPLSDVLARVFARVLAGVLAGVLDGAAADGSLESPAVFFVAPEPRRPRRRRAPVDVLGPASGIASSCWVSTVESIGASSPAPMSLSSFGTGRAGFAAVDVVAGRTPPPLPRPRPPRLRRRFGAVDVGPLSPSVGTSGASETSALSAAGRARGVAFGVDRGADLGERGVALAGDSPSSVEGASGRSSVVPAGASAVAPDPLAVPPDPPPPLPLPPRLRGRLGAPGLVGSPDGASDGFPRASGVPTICGVPRWNALRSGLTVVAVSAATGLSWFIR